MRVTARMYPVLSKTAHMLSTLDLKPSLTAGDPALLLLHGDWAGDAVRGMKDFVKQLVGCATAPNVPRDLQLLNLIGCFKVIVNALEAFADEVRAEEEKQRLEVA